MYRKYLLLILFFLFISQVALPATVITAKPQLQNICSSANSKSVETFPIELSWTVLNENFYNEEDFLNLKHSVLFDNNDLWMPYIFDHKYFYGDFISPLNSFYFDRTKPLHPDLGKYLDALNTRSTITGKKLIKTHLTGSEWNDGGQFLFLNPRVLMSEFEIDYGFPVTFKKNVTAAEACQILNTLLLEIEVSYAVYEPDPSDNSKKIKVEKKDIIYLSAKNEDNTKSN